MPKLKLICETCGKEYEKYPSQVGKHHFCSNKCYQAYHQRNTKTYTCEVCGKEFRSSNTGNANRFCSRECYNQFHMIKDKERECPVCHKIFIAKQSEDKYCSQKCYLEWLHKTHKKESHPNWKGGISQLNDRHDSNEYKKWRQAVYERDNYRCVKCGSKEKINAHHKRSWKYYPDLRYDVDNGITVCEQCHIQLHRLYGYDTDQVVE